MKKGLFLDRDGVINHDIGYVHRIGDIRFVEGIFQVCRAFQERDFLIFVVSNQSGVARGFFSEKKVQRLHEWMAAQFDRKKIRIEKFYYCAHHPRFGGCPPENVVPCRKPSPGMILQAEQEFGLDLSRSLLIGDKEIDILAGINAGITNNVRVKSKYTDGSLTQATIVVREIHDLLENNTILPPL